MHADIQWHTLQVAHGVISFHSDEVFSPGKFPDYTLTFLASWGVTQIFQLVLGNESFIPEEHKKTVCSVCEALLEI